MQLSLDSLEHLAADFDQLHGLPIKCTLGSSVAKPLPFGLCAALKPLKRDRSGGTAAVETTLLRMLLGGSTTLHAGASAHTLDSQIACGVMLRLMDQGIVALPVHDSFLVQREFESELITAMQAEFVAVMGASGSLKETELPIDGFEKLQKRRDLNPLTKALRDSVHDRYVRSWRRQNLEPKHQNLSFYPPYRFPDEPASGKPVTTDAPNGEQR